MIATPSLFQQMVSVQNLFDTWDHFKRGKRKKRDVQTFERNLEDNILRLHEDLISFKYAHGRYQSFKVTDPKERNINAASIKDRLVHQIITTTLTKIVDNASFGYEPSYFVHLNSQTLCKTGKNHE